MRIHARTVNGSITIELSEPTIDKIKTWTKSEEEFEQVKEHLQQRAKDELNDIVRYAVGSGGQIRDIVEPDDSEQNTLSSIIAGGHVTL